MTVNGCGSCGGPFVQGCLGPLARSLALALFTALAPCLNVSRGVAAEPAWGNSYARVYYKLGNDPTPMVMVLPKHAAQSKDVADYNKAIGELLHKSGVTMSPEFFLYITNPQDDPSQEVSAVAAPSAYFKSMQEAQAAPDQTPNFWVQLIYDDEGGPESSYSGCLNVERVGNVTKGCGDPWQEGLKNSDLACVEGKTYIRCQLDCRRQYREPTLSYAPGPCPQP